MKKLALLVLLCLPLAGVAAVLTVNNRGGAQYTGVQAALDAAAVGDTIYVHGSPTSYGSFTVRKRLVLIGAGYKSINEQNLATIVSTISLYREAGVADASGSVFCGFSMTGGLNGNAGTGGLPINNIRVFRNFIQSLNAGGSSAVNDGWLIYNNIISALSGAGSFGRARNIGIYNNIITGGISWMQEPSVIIDHNLFLGSYVLTSITYATISNNIFVRSSNEIILGGTVLHCIFTNNISNLILIGPAAQYSPSNTFEATFLGAGGGMNTGSGNIVGVDVQLENVTNLNNYSDLFNYRLKSTSPAKGKGSDGTDLGIYAPPYPFPSGGPIGSGYDTSARPPIPQVLEVNIQTPTVNPNGSINVKVRAAVNN